MARSYFVHFGYTYTTYYRRDMRAEEVKTRNRTNNFSTQFRQHENSSRGCSHRSISAYPPRSYAVTRLHIPCIGSEANYSCSSFLRNTPHKSYEKAKLSNDEKPLNCANCKNFEQCCRVFAVFLDAELWSTEVTTSLFLEYDLLFYLQCSSK